jgi:hypothetical protein
VTTPHSQKALSEEFKMHTVHIYQLLQTSQFTGNVLEQHSNSADTEDESQVVRVVNTYNKARMKKAYLSL